MNIPRFTITGEPTTPLNPRAALAYLEYVVEDRAPLFTGIPASLNTLSAALDERDSLRKACENAEQTLRNLASGFLTGNTAVIASNEADNLRAAMEER